VRWVCDGVEEDFETYELEVKKAPVQAKGSPVADMKAELNFQSPQPKSGLGRIGF
jgi:hypothetical protein